MLRQCERFLVPQLSNNITKVLFSSSFTPSIPDDSSTDEASSPKIQSVVRNRNPRNLEMMRIGYKPTGYHLDKQNKSYWHKLELTRNQKNVIAQVIHFRNGPVIEVSTSEMSIKKQLYRSTDTSAHINLGRVLAERCLRAGITQMFCNIEVTPGGKVEKFIEQLKEGGVILEESDRYKKPNPWDQHRPPKPWEIQV